MTIQLSTPSFSPEDVPAHSSAELGQTSLVAAQMPLGSPAESGPFVAPPPHPQLFAQQLASGGGPISISHPELSEVREALLIAGLMEEDGRLTPRGEELFTRTRPYSGWEEQWRQDWAILQPIVEKALASYVKLLEEASIEPLKVGDIGPFAALIGMAINAWYADPEIQEQPMRPSITLDRFGTREVEGEPYPIGYLNHLDYFEYHQFAGNALYTPGTSPSQSFGFIGLMNREILGYSSHAARYGIDNLSSDIRGETAVVGLPTAHLLQRVLFDRAEEYPLPLLPSAR